MSSTAYRSARRDAAIVEDALSTLGPCNRCGSNGFRDDLALFGAMCRPCFDAYKADANPRWWPNRELTADERASVIRRVKQRLQKLGDRAPSKDWAARLRQQEAAGQHLSPTQRRMWREAFGLPLTASASPQQELA